jgi:hypothetical protein
VSALALVIIPSAAAPAWPPAGLGTGSVYYVSTAGSDVTGNGTQSKPWASFYKADSNIGPGAIVHVMPGTYKINPTGSNGVYTRTNGTSANPITWLSDTWQGATIDGQGTCFYTWNNAANYVNIYGFALTGTEPGTNSGSGSCCIVSTGNNVNVGWCHVHDLLPLVAVGIDMCPKDTSGNYSDGPFTVHDCVIDNIGYGYPYDLCGYGIYDAGAGLIYNNLIYRCGTYGIHCWHGDSGTRIFNNTIDSVGYSGTAGTFGAGIVAGTGDGGAQPNTWLQVCNNVITNCAYLGIFAIEYSPGTLSRTNTIFQNNLVPNYSANSWFDSYGGWTPLSSNFTVTATVTSNPTFVNSSGGDYHLQSGSPAIDAGNSGIYFISSTDLDGNPRIVGSSIDIGAYEFQGYNIIGSVTLGNFVGNAAAWPIRLILQQNGSVVYAQMVTGSGNPRSFTLPNMYPGTYDLTIEVMPHWLRKVIPGIVVSNQNLTLGTTTLINGDVNGDNFVEDQDYSLMGAAWYSSVGDSNYNVNADLNGDGFVEDQDYSIMGQAWYQSGD